jgi:uncharacterized protein
MAPAERLRIEVVYCPRPSVVDRVTLDLDGPVTVADALRLSGVLERHGLQMERILAGIWGRVQAPTTMLRAFDRVEVYRPLTVDPKEARRLRYRRDRTGPRR